MADVTQWFEYVRAGDVAAVRAALAGDATLLFAVDAHGKSALHQAAEAKQAGTARVLLDAGADVEARTAWGATPFDWAAHLGACEVAELLLERGATGLDLVSAAGLGRLADVRRIVESGDDLAGHARRGAGAADWPDHWPPVAAFVRGDVLGDAFWAACRNGHTAVAGYLHGKGAAIDSRGVFGGTALMWAAIEGHADTVRWLTAHGAVLALRDTHWESTAEGWAREGGHAPIVLFLRQAAGGA